MKKILFITHETSRTGAPLIVLYFMRWLKLNHPQIEIDCLSLSTGDLIEDFKSVSHHLYEVDSTSDSSIVKRLMFKVKGISQKANKKRKLLNKLKEQHYDLVYANSILSLKWGTEIKSLKGNSKLLLHLHELEVNIKTYAPNFEILKGAVDQFICASNLVQNNLLDNHDIPDYKTKVIYEYSDLESELPEEIEQSSKNKFVIGASGSVNFRKGYDLFLCVAKAVLEQTNEAIEFHWIGKFSNKKIQLEVEADILKAGLEKHVFFKGEFNNPEEAFKLFDVFLMTSREDPFPLVCIEVGNLGKPIICFEGATGTEEILKEGGGKIVSYLSISEMAKEVLKYISNPQEIKKDGLEAHKRFKKFSIENQCPIIYNTIQDL